MSTAPDILNIVRNLPLTTYAGRRAGLAQTSLVLVRHEHAARGVALPRYFLATITSLPHTTSLITCRTHRDDATRRPSRCDLWEHDRATSTYPRGRRLREHRSARRFRTWRGTGLACESARRGAGDARRTRRPVERRICALS